MATTTIIYSTKAGYAIAIVADLHEVATVRSYAEAERVKELLDKAARTSGVPIPGLRKPSKRGVPQNTGPRSKTHEKGPPGKDKPKKAAPRPKVDAKKLVAALKKPK